MDRDIIISLKVVLLTTLLFGGAYILYRLGPIILILVVATLLVVSMEHTITIFMRQRFMNKPLGRGPAVLLTYFILVVSVIVVFTIALPPVVMQAQKLAIQIITYVADIPMFESVDFSSLTPNITDLSKNILNVAGSIISTVAAAVSIVAIAVYMSLDLENIKKRFLALFVTSKKLQDEVKDTIREVEESIGYWTKGQLFLMVTIGLLSFIGLAILGVDYPLALGMAAGLLEIIPILGPIIALVLAGVVGFSESVVKGIAVVALFVAIQQIENNILVPKVMNKVSGFTPLVVLIAVLVGGSLLGFLGALIAIPLMMIGVIVMKRVLRYKG